MLLELLATDAVTYLFPTIPETDADDSTQSGMAINGDRAYPTISCQGGKTPPHQATFEQETIGLRPRL